jgi:hypothetical protein
MALAKARINPRIANDDRFTTAVQDPGSRIFERHGARQPHAFLDSHVRRHADAADRRSHRDVVDDQHGLQL